MKSRRKESTWIHGCHEDFIEELSVIPRHNIILFDLSICGIQNAPVSPLGDSTRLYLLWLLRPNWQSTPCSESIHTPGGSLWSSHVSGLSMVFSKPLS